VHTMHAHSCLQPRSALRQASGCSQPSRDQLRAPTPKPCDKRASGCSHPSGTRPYLQLFSRLGSLDSRQLPGRFRAYMHSFQAAPRQISGIYHASPGTYFEMNLNGRSRWKREKMSRNDWRKRRRKRRGKSCLVWAALTSSAGGAQPRVRTARIASNCNCTYLVLVVIGHHDPTGELTHSTTGTHEPQLGYLVVPTIK
jgi:hypothetical protein